MTRLISIARLLSPWIAVTVPLLIAIPRLASNSVWRDDLPTVQALGLVSVGNTSTLSTWLMLAASMLPIGTLTLRLALVSALGIAVCGWLVWVLARSLLETHVPNHRINTLVALVASLNTTVVAIMQSEATTAAGATISVACFLGIMTVFLMPHLSTWYRYLCTAACTALLVANDLPSAVVAIIAVSLAGVVRKDRLPVAQRWILAAVFVGISIVLVIPWVLRAFSPFSLFHFGLALGRMSLPTLDISAQTTNRLLAWYQQLGAVTLCVAAFGFVIGFVRRRMRPFMLPWVIILLADAVLTSPNVSLLTTDAVIALRCLAIVSLVLSACVGVQTVVVTLLDTGVAMGKAAAVLVMLFYVSQVGMLSERTLFTVDQANRLGAISYTDEALMRLEPGAMVLVRSDAVLWRLYAANIVSGARSDIIVVPMLLLDRADQAAKLIAREPASALLLRDHALEASIGQRALSAIADKRYLYTELDPNWDSAAASLLSADRLWLRVQVQPVARSDRHRAAKQAMQRVDQLVKSLPFDHCDDVTKAAISSIVRQQTIAAAIANDRQATQQFLTTLGEVSPHDWFVKTMSQRLLFARDTSIDVMGLLR